MPVLWAKLRHWLGGEREEAALHDEMAAHLEFEIEERLARGMTPEQARTAARRHFGNAAAIAERTRETWTVRWISGLARDVRFALRSMARRPAFATVAVLSLAIALGANTAVFSFVNAIVWKKLPVAGAERLVILRQKNEQFHMENCCFSFRFFREIRRQDTGLEDVLAIASPRADLTDRGETERVRAELVSGNYFRMLGVRPAAGRLLTEEDDAVEGASPVCVISYKLWQERFGGDPGVVGRRVALGGTPFQIVGVTPRGFGGTSLHQPRDLEAPTAMIGSFYGDKRDVLSFQLIGRVKPGVTPAEAQSRLNATGRAVQKALGEQMRPNDDFLLRAGSQGVNSAREELGKPVLVLFLLVGVLLVVACANLAALLLVRSVERTREAEMRLAIGASRAVLFRQFLTEAVLLAAAGGAAGWVFALALVRVLLNLLTQNEAMTKMVRPDAAVFAFSAAATLAAGVLFGLLPAWRASRADPLPAIHGTAVARPGRRSMLARGVIAAQIGLSLALVFSAGLFTRTLRNLRAVDLGFQPDNLLTLEVNLARSPYEKQAVPLFAELLRRARELPETRAASLSALNIVTGSMMATRIEVPGYIPPNGVPPTSYISDVSDGYFRTMGTPLLGGTDFSHGGEPHLAIVNDQFAKRFLGGEALGKSFRLGRDETVRVAGVVQTVKYRYLREEPQPVIYMPLLPNSRRTLIYLQVRTTGESKRAAARLTALVRELAPAVPVTPPIAMEMQLDEALVQERLLAFLSTLLGVVAAALAAIGLYGVLSFAVTRRTREIGIRLSIGAQRTGIVALFLRESLWIVAAGLAAGIPLTLACGGLAESLLFGLKGRDSGIVLIAIAGLAAVAIVSAAIPAARAARTDPMRALRHE
jgi:predicted permease